MAGQELWGSITVHTPDCVESLKIDHDDRIYTTMVRRANKQRLLSRRPWSTPNPNRSTASVASSRASTASVRSLDNMTKIQNWISEKSIRNIQEKADPESKQTKKMYMSLLDEEEGFVKDVDDFVKNKEYLDLRKKEMLHKKWSERVYEPLQAQVYKEMKQEYPEVERRKRNLHDDYVEYCNRRPVFLDTMSKADYNPLQLQVPRPAPIVAETQTFDDPLIAQEKVRNEEDRITIRCQTGKTLSDRDVERYRLPSLPLVPLGRHGTECSTWLRMQLHDIDSQVRYQSRRRMRSNFNETHFDFDEWGKMSFDSKIVDEEMQCQKKRMYTDPHATFVFV
ncbi:protein FAM228B-like [Ptychodera flava]|uniref:protein FAM228B-like n=1 Tax=Ptychodera flava TaxID=63121 RepID=UPI00396A7E30